MAEKRTKAENEENASPNIFKLNVDCFGKLFDWLQLTDLLILSQTCKGMKQVVDYYIELNYPNASHLRLDKDRFEKIRQFVPNIFHCPKHLSIHSVELTTQIQDIAYILNRIESLRLKWVKGNDCILQHCTNLKYLSIFTLNTFELFDIENGWLLRTFPKLEHFELTMIGITEGLPNYIQLKSFFRRNPNIRIFSTDFDFLIECYHSLLGSDIKFDRLNVLVTDYSDLLTEITNVLHEDGFYKKLQVCWVTDHRRLPKFSGLQKLILLRTFDTFDVPQIESLTELSLNTIQPQPNNMLDLMARNFINLNRISFDIGSLNQVRPLVRFAVKLERVLFRTLYSKDDDDIEKQIMALNSDRKQLPNARKITIYIDEEQFLILKWYSKVNFSFIDFKRSNFCEKDNLFERF